MSLILCIYLFNWWIWIRLIFCRWVWGKWLFLNGRVGWEIIGIIFKFWNCIIVLISLKIECGDFFVVKVIMLWIYRFVGCWWCWICYLNLMLLMIFWCWLRLWIILMSREYVKRRGMMKRVIFVLNVFL